MKFWLMMGFCQSNCGSCMCYTHFFYVHVFVFLSSIYNEHVAIQFNDIISRDENGCPLNLFPELETFLFCTPVSWRSFLAAHWSTKKKQGFGVWVRDEFGGRKSSSLIMSIPPSLFVYIHLQDEEIKRNPSKVNGIHILELPWEQMFQLMTTLKF